MRVEVDEWIFFYKQKTAYDMRVSDWSSDVFSSDLLSSRLKRNSASPLLAGASLASKPMIGPAGTGARRVVAARARQSWVSASTSMKTMMRSEERRVGKECVSTGSTRRSPDN